MTGRILAKTDAGWALKCPGCGSIHIIPTTNPNVSWSFNGDMARPTFSPSVRHTWHYGDSREPRCCHYFIEDGQIKFCNDCTHTLAGKTLPLPELPENLFEEDAR